LKGDVVLIRSDRDSRPLKKPQSMKRPVVCEQYEEIVFTDPTENFHKKLLSFPTPETILPHPLSHQTRSFSSLVIRITLSLFVPSSAVSWSLFSFDANDE